MQRANCCKLLSGQDSKARWGATCTWVDECSAGCVHRGCLLSAAHAGLLQTPPLQLDNNIQQNKPHIDCNPLSEVWGFLCRVLGGSYSRDTLCFVYCCSNRGLSRVLCLYAGYYAVIVRACSLLGHALTRVRFAYVAVLLGQLRRPAAWLEECTHPVLYPGPVVHVGYVFSCTTALHFMYRLAAYPSCTLLLRQKQACGTRCRMRVYVRCLLSQVCPGPV